MITITHPTTGKVIDLADAIALRKLGRRYHPLYNAALAINNTMARHKHAGLDMETALAAIEDQINIILSAYQQQAERQPTKPTYSVMQNAAISVANVISWQRDGYLDDDTALAMICEYNFVILSAFEQEPKKEKATR